MCETAKKYRKIEKQNSAKNSGESANNFLYDFTWRKTQFSRNAHEKPRKCHYLVGFWRFSFHVKPTPKIKLFHVKHRCFQLIFMMYCPVESVVLAALVIRTQTMTYVGFIRCFHVVSERISLCFNAQPPPIAPSSAIKPIANVAACFDLRPCPLFI